jgi:DNA-binding YbaB/EbfC family protein
MVTVTLTGKGMISKMHIDPTIVDPNDVALLEDLMTAAFNDAKTKVDALVADKMSEVTGGLQLPPGIKLPF